MGGEPQSVLISGGCLKQGQSSISLLINRAWCQGSCKSDLFQIPSGVFSLLIQCLRYAFETWFGKIANAPVQLSRWATTAEPECPSACDLHQERHRIGKPAKHIRLQNGCYAFLKHCGKYRVNYNIGKNIELDAIGLKEQK